MASKKVAGRPKHAMETKAILPAPLRNSVAARKGGAEKRPGRGRMAFENQSGNTPPKSTKSGAKNLGARAKKGVKTKKMLPAPKTKITAGKAAGVKAGVSNRPVKNQTPRDTLATSKIGAGKRAKPQGGGQQGGENQDFIAPATNAGAKRAANQRGEVQTGDETQRGHDLSATCSQLMDLQRTRVFCIVSQSRCDRSMESQLARWLGLPKPPADWKDEKQKAAWQKAAKPIYAKASALRRAIEKDKDADVIKDILRGHELFARTALSTATIMIVTNFASRKNYDALRASTQAEMRRLAQTLPAWPFVKNVEGFAELGLAIIVAECGNLSDYATKERVWKRLGLAVINGERQQKKTGAEAAAAHGYVPKRRAAIWAQIDPMLRHQIAAPKDEDGKDPTKSGKPIATPGKPKAYYGEIYYARRAHTAGREGWSDRHAKNDAVRIMTKALVKDIWREWRRVAGGGRRAA